MCKVKFIILAGLLTNEQRLISQICMCLILLSCAMHNVQMLSWVWERGLVNAACSLGVLASSLCHPHCITWYFFSLSLPCLMLSRFPVHTFTLPFLSFNVCNTGSSKKCILFYWAPFGWCAFGCFSYKLNCVVCTIL